MQWSPAFEASGVDVGACGKKDADDGLRGAVRGMVKCSHVVAVVEVEFEVWLRGARLEGCGDTVVAVVFGADCEVQRGVAVVVCRIYVGAVSEEELHDVIVAVHGGVVERCVGAATHVADTDVDDGRR